MRNADRKPYPALSAIRVERSLVEVMAQRPRPTEETLDSSFVAEVLQGLSEIQNRADLNAPPFDGEDFNTNLIMPEPTIFLDRKFPVCSIIRPTETNGAATGAASFLTATGLFNGQSQAFFDALFTLADEADDAQPEGHT